MVLIRKPRARTVTEAQVCRYLGRNLEILKDEAKERVCEEIDRLTSNELFDRFWDGRKQYGEFDVEAIPCKLEMKREALDFLWYLTFSHLQHEH